MSEIRTFDRGKKYDTVLISIKPPHTDRIFKGEKKAELRVTYPAQVDLPFRVLVYETGPGVRAVIGEFECVDVYDACNIKKVAKLACMSCQAAEEYINSRGAYLWMIRNPKRYERPKALYEVCDKKRPPQTWVYLK